MPYLCIHYSHIIYLNLLMALNSWFVIVLLIYLFDTNVSLCLIILIMLFLMDGMIFTVYAFVHHL